MTLFYDHFSSRNNVFQVVLVVAYADWMNHCPCLKLCKPDFSVISSAVIALHDATGPHNLSLIHHCVELFFCIFTSACCFSAKVLEWDNPFLVSNFLVVASRNWFSARHTPPHSQLHSPTCPEFSWRGSAIPSRLSLKIHVQVVCHFLRQCLATSSFERSFSTSF